MKNIKFLATAIFATILFSSCSNEDDVPVIVNEEELITTLTVQLNPNGGGTQVIFQSRDLDGDGPNPPVITVSGGLVAGTVYSGQIFLLNESVTPPVNITEEVEEEDLEHQLFYTVGGGLDVTTAYANFDSDGNNLGTLFTLTAGATSTGNMTFTLRHEPTKPNTGLLDAGGETDVAATFDVTVQ